MMRRHLILPALALLVLPAMATEPKYVETNEHLFVHNAATGCTDETQQFLVYDEPQAGSNCGYIYGLPLNEVDHHAEAGLFGGREYGTEAPFEIILDADRNLTGTVVVAARTSVCPSPAPPPVPCVETGQGTGAGEVIVDIVASGIEGTFIPVQIGSAQVSTLVTPGTVEYAMDFSIDIPDSVDERVLSGVTLSLNARGVHVHTGYLNASGKSFIDVPSLTPVEAGE